MVPLMFGAALLLRSFSTLTNIEAGLNVNDAAALEVILPGSRYSQEAEIARFYEDLLDRIRTSPDVSAVGAVNNMPFRFNSCDGFRLPDRPVPPPGQRPCASNQLVTPGYFAAAGIEILEGRTFLDSDDVNATPVLVINNEMADTFWPQKSAVGEQVSYNGIPRWVVGVVASVRRHGLDEEPSPEMFIPHAQDAWDGQMFLVIRTESPLESTVSMVRSHLDELDASVPIGMIAPVKRLISDSVAQPRLQATLVAFFALVALVLATIGIYGIVGYTVSRRTGEFGLRLALGAEPRTIRKMVLRDGLRIALAGLMVGLVGALATAKAIEGLLFGVGSTDPVTLVGVTGFFLIVALAACYAPTRRIASDPTVALKWER